MSLTENQLTELFEVAKSTASLAGEFIASKQGKEISTQLKEGGENIASQVVTEIDFHSEKIILEQLTPTLAKYDLGLLTEESTDDCSRFEHDYFWCIDPLDGTLAFSRNEDGYSTSIALISRDGNPIIGAVYNPRSNTLYSALKSKGAFKNDRPLQVAKRSKTLTLLYDQSYLSHPEFELHKQNLSQKAKEIGQKGLELYQLGGAVMNGITTIEKAPALYYKFPKENQGGGSLWDFAASSVIQSEAGGFNSDFQRNPLDLNRSDSTFMNHRGVIYASDETLLEIIPKI